MPVLNYDVIYNMCEPQLHGSGVSYRSVGGRLISAWGQLRSMMTQSEQRCERMVRPGVGINPCIRSGVVTVTRGVKGSIGREKVIFAWGQVTVTDYVKWHVVWKLGPSVCVSVCPIKHFTGFSLVKQTCLSIVRVHILW